MEATLLGARLSMVAALSVVFLFGMEFCNCSSVSMATSVIVDNRSDEDFLWMEFNISFPAVSSRRTAVDVNNVLETSTGSEFNSGPLLSSIKHGDEVGEGFKDYSTLLNAQNFERYANQYPILVVDFYAPWCYWSKKLKPSWEEAAKIIRERYDPDIDGRILLGRVDCTDEAELCRRHRIQGYPSVRIFRKGSDIRDDHGHQYHESYYGDRDTESLVKTMEDLVAPLPAGLEKGNAEPSSTEFSRKLLSHFH